MSQLKGKVALVTGGAIRVGKAIALELAHYGAHIALHYNTSREAALSTQKEIEAACAVKVLLVQADLSKTEQIKSIVQKTMDQFGHIDILVNNASIFEKTPYETLDETSFDHNISINLKAPYLLSKLCGDIMLNQQSGHVINITDSAATHARKNFLPYNLSKAGLSALTLSLAAELAPYVLVNSVAPGIVLPQANDVHSLDKIPLHKIGTPEDVAKAVRFLVCDAPYITGATIPVDGGKYTLKIN